MAFGGQQINRLKKWNSSATSILYAGGFGGVSKSTDGGLNWTEINQGLTSTGTSLSIEAIAVDPVNTNILYTSTQRLFKVALGCFSTIAAMCFTKNLEK